jgi:ATP-dependent DNA helicase RecG
VSRGHQVYVVCPRIGGEPESAVMEPLADDDSAPRRPAMAVADVAAELIDGPLAGLRVFVLHGRLPGDEKDEVMRRFAAGDVDVLVATTVIEVGVDVENATVMIVQEADRFGLAQLHQLRGRVGRGGEQSYCLLVSRPKAELTEDAQRRLEALVATTDGFELAEVDLDLRGEGQLLGTRQSGLSDLRFTRLRADRPLLEQARRAAEELIDLEGLLADEVDRVFAELGTAELA